MTHTIPDSLTLGDKVRAVRKSLGLTQPQLALAAGVGVRFVVELEAGKPTLRFELVLRVIHALGGVLFLDFGGDGLGDSNGSRVNG